MTRQERHNKMIGKTNYNLTVVSCDFSKPKTYYICKCKCGNTTRIRSDQFSSGKTKSCGCWKTTKGVRKIKQNNELKRQKREKHHNEMIGKTSYNLTVKDYIYENKRTFYICDCKCGNTTRVRSDEFLKQGTKSCGCWKTRKAGRRNDALYSRWRLMKNRCYNKEYKSYHRYGGRGIKVYRPWIDEFWEFSKYCREVLGFTDDQKHLQIDRIDNNGNYEPNNIRFVTAKQNMNNRRNTPMINGKSLSEIAKETGLNRNTLYQRYKSGVRSYEEIIKPSRKSSLNSSNTME